MVVGFLLLRTNVIVKKKKKKKKKKEEEEEGKSHLIISFIHGLGVVNSFLAISDFFEFFTTHKNEK